MGAIETRPNNIRLICMPECRSILFAASEEGVKEQVFQALSGIETYSLICVGDSADLLIKILDADIDLAIIDMELSGIAGSKVVEIIKKSRPRIPLIILAAGNSTETVARILEQGVFYFLVKPIVGAELRSAVESALK